jgi:hypothetical protein
LSIECKGFTAGEGLYIYPERVTLVKPDSTVNRKICPKMKSGIGEGGDINDVSSGRK